MKYSQICLSTLAVTHLFSFFTKKFYLVHILYFGQYSVDIWPVPIVHVVYWRGNKLFEQHKNARRYYGLYYIMDYIMVYLHLIKFQFTGNVFTRVK